VQSSSPNDVTCVDELAHYSSIIWEISYFQMDLKLQNFSHLKHFFIGLEENIKILNLSTNLSTNTWLGLSKIYMLM